MNKRNNINELPVILKALADKTRFKIINLLLTHDLCVGALAHHLGISKAAVSQHLQILRKAGLVKGEKCGYWTHYSVEKDVLNEIADELKKIASRSVYRKCVCSKKPASKTDRGMQIIEDTPSK